MGCVQSTERDWPLSHVRPFFLTFRLRRTFVVEKRLPSTQRKLVFFIWCWSQHFSVSIVQSVQRNTHIHVYHILKKTITRKGIGMGHLLVSWGPRSWQELFHVMWMTKWDLYGAGLLHSYSELAQLDLGLGNVNKLPWVAALGLQLCLDGFYIPKQHFQEC